MPRSYTLTSALVAAHAGGPVVALDATAVGRSFRAFRSRPGPERNKSARAELARLRGDYPGPSGRVVQPEPEATPDVVLVTAIGPLEQHATQHDPSGSWIDGHDALSERLCSAFEVGDVIFCLDGPGGAVKGGPEMIRRAVEAKARYGRRCIGHTEGDCCSAHYWWALAVCDEFYVSADGFAGSVGVRGMLASIAGALAKEGVTVEVFEDPEGKAAGVPELPISEEARQRAQHEIAIAADMFRAAVCDSVIGKRAGLTPEALKSYRGRGFSGQEAVDAGLADGVATLEDVMSYALATAGSGASMDDPKKDEPGAEDAPPKNNDKPDDEGACAKCGKALAEEERYCGRCGTDRVPAGEDDDGPPSSEAPKKDEGKAIVPPAARQASTVAEALGLAPTASYPRIMTELLDVLRTADTAALVTGRKAQGEIRGGLVALVEDVRNAVAVKRELEAAQAKEMIALALRAAKVEGSRDGWVEDVVTDDGKRKGLKLGPKARGYTRDELKGYVEGKEKNGAPRRNPFAASRDAAEQAKNGALAEGVKNAPAVVQATKAGVKPDVAAGILAREFGGAA